MFELFHPSSIFLALFSLYVLGVAIFLLLENRRPKSTIAWMFLFFIFPVLGVISYLLFGRGHKAFSKRDDLMEQELGGEITKLLAPLAAWFTSQVTA